MNNNWLIPLIITTVLAGLLMIGAHEIITTLQEHDLKMAELSCETDVCRNEFGHLIVCDNE